MSDNLITVKVFSTEIEAEIYKGLLKSSGINAYIFKDDFGGMRPHLQTSQGVELKVYQEDANQAKNILEANDKDKDSTDNYNPVENIVAILSVCAWMIFFAGIGFIIVGKSDNKFVTSLGVVLLLAGIILEVVSRRKKKAMKIYNKNKT